MFTIASLHGILWVGEKRLGIADRGRAAGITFSHIICASILSNTVVIVGQICIIVAICVKFYGLTMGGSWALAVILMFIVSLAGQSLGYFWASFCNNEMDIVMIQLFYLTTLMTSSGNFDPR